MIHTPVKQWRRQKEVASLIGKTGDIVQWTMIRTPATAFVKEAPYPVVIVELKNKEKMIGQLVDWQEKDLKIGTKVTAVLRRIPSNNPEGIISYYIKFKPA